jgi:ubiquinone/menaquinone biosynthesis C-methylase UbiE
VVSHRPPLYDAARAGFFREWEAPFRIETREKIALIRQRLGDCRRLVDIGCGWGQLLATLQGDVPELWGVDESRDQVKGITESCPAARILICRADGLALRGGCFDVVVTSQMLHEVVLFGGPHELRGVLSEIRRVLAAGGRYLMLDHADAGDGDVVVDLPPKALDTLREFEDKFISYRASHAMLDGRRLRISKRCLQDFASKDWSLGSPMESLEMAETHNVFARDATVALLTSAGLRVVDWISFSDLRRDLERLGGRLVRGSTWHRKFLLVATKA